jgi:EAL and modified HD-GYP domain-containing signal transduction protein
LDRGILECSSLVIEEARWLTAGQAGDPAVSQPHRFLARQPILDTRRAVIGYELLFRSGWENCFRGERDEATRRTLDNYVYLDIESLTNDGLAFVNCTREAILGRWVTLLPPKNTVLEILETVSPDAELVKACIDLRKMGYRIALDDFVARPEMEPLVEIASYIKVDFRLSDAQARKEIRLMTRASRAALLAKKWRPRKTSKWPRLKVTSSSRATSSAGQASPPIARFRPTG